MLRIDRKITQEALAEKVGISANAIGQFERGTILPKLETLGKIVEVLDIDANLLFPRESINYSEDALWIANILRKYNDDEKEVLGRFFSEISQIFCDAIIGKNGCNREGQNENCDL